MAANLVILEFSDLTPDGQAVWPASKRTAQPSTDTFTTRANTKLMVICADASCRMAIGGDAATAADYPILTSVANEFPMTGGAQTVKFL